jgi:hypothetical protein
VAWQACTVSSLMSSPPPTNLCVITAALLTCVSSLLLCKLCVIALQLMRRNRCGKAGMYGGIFDVISTFNSTTWPSGEQQCHK